MHLGEYAIFGVLLARAMKMTFQFDDIRKLFLLVLLIAFIYGISDEIHQAFVPGRTASIFDAISDGFGGLIGAIIFRWRR